MLNEQVCAAENPLLQRLLIRIRRDTQDQTGVDLLNSRCYRQGRRISWESTIIVVRPSNSNRWNLNIEPTLSFQKQQNALVPIFMSEHRWQDAQTAEEEAFMVLGQGNDSSIAVPAVFMFVQGVPVVVNRNTPQGLKLVNGASYEALDIILEKAHPCYRINADTILHFGPPAAILPASEMTTDFHFVGMPPEIVVLLTPISTIIECQRKRP